MFFDTSSALALASAPAAVPKRDYRTLLHEFYTEFNPAKVLVRTHFIGISPLIIYATGCIGAPRWVQWIHCYKNTRIKKKNFSQHYAKSNFLCHDWTLAHSKSFHLCTMPLFANTKVSGSQTLAWRQSHGASARTQSQTICDFCKREN